MHALFPAILITIPVLTLGYAALSYPVFKQEQEVVVHEKRRLKQLRTHDAERQRVQEEVRAHVAEFNRRPRPPECPGIYYPGALIFDEYVWVELPSKPGVCDFTIEHGEQLEFKNNNDLIEIVEVQGVQGLSSNTVPTHARAKKGAGKIVSGFMLCPQGKRPIDGSRRCRPTW